MNKRNFIAGTAEAINPVAKWFVTYQPVGSTSRKGYSRSSKQFANEQDAKAFAKDRLAKGMELRPEL
jgi:hypothetical protein